MAHPESKSLINVHLKKNVVYKLRAFDFKISSFPSLLVVSMSQLLPRSLWPDDWHVTFKTLPILTLIWSPTQKGDTILAVKLQRMQQLITPVTFFKIRKEQPPSKHINVELMLKQRWSSMFVDVISTLINSWKWKLRRRTFFDVVSTLAKQRWNNVDGITLVQCRWTNVILSLKLG